MVEVTTPALPGKTLSAPIKFIDPNLNETTRSAKVRVELPNPIIEENGQKHRLLLHRLFAEGAVKLETPAVLALPRTAILNASESLVYVELSNGAYEQRKVKLGRRGDDFVEVLKGVNAGERVVTTGNLLIDAQAQLNATTRSMERQPAQVPVQSTARTNVQAMAEPVPAAAFDDAQLKVATNFLAAAATVSDALAKDDLAAFNNASAKVHELMPPLLDVLGVRAEWRPLLKPIEAASHFERAANLEAARKQFVPFSAAVSAFAEKLRAAGPVKIYECPMTDRAVKGAPKRVRWIQSTGPLRNPFFGSEMIDCGSEVKP